MALNAAKNEKSSVDKRKLIFIRPPGSVSLRFSYRFGTILAESAKSKELKLSNAAVLRH
jgi:hypothetical protein